MFFKQGEISVFSFFMWSICKCYFLSVFVCASDKYFYGRCGSIVLLCSLIVCASQISTLFIFFQLKKIFSSIIVFLNSYVYVYTVDFFLYYYTISTLPATPSAAPRTTQKKLVKTSTRVVIRQNTTRNEWFRREKSSLPL